MKWIRQDYEWRGKRRPAGLKQHHRLLQVTLKDTEGSRPERVAVFADLFFLFRRRFADFDVGARDRAL